MNLIDENEVKEQSENQQKMKKIILFVIAALILIVLSLVIYSVIKNKNTLKLDIDGKDQKVSSGLVLMSEDGKNVYMEDDHIYFSIRKLKDMLGNVEIFNDEYKGKGEDSTKCCIKLGNEYTSYISNSQQVYKAVVFEDDIDNNSDTNKKTQNKDEKETITEYEYFTIDKPVKNVNGELYASDDAIELGFNVILNYDNNNKQIEIYTLDYLEQTANKKITTNTAVIGDECDYSNKKLLKYGLVLVKNSNGNYGITSYGSNKEIITCKYSKIRFSEASATVTVTVAEDNLQGIFKLDLMNEKSECKIQPIYQLIRQIDEENEIYLVKTNNKYGIIKMNGEEVSTVLDSEYEQMGLDKAYENMTNKYIIEGNKKYIPVKIDGKWGLYTIEGDRVIHTQYDGIGCTLNDAGDPVVIIPNLREGADAIVCVKNITIAPENSNAYNAKPQIVSKYVLVNTETREEFGYESNEIYSKYEESAEKEAQRVYYMKLDVNGATVRDIDIVALYGKKATKKTTVEEIKGSTQNNTNTINDTNTINNTTNSAMNNNAYTTNSNTIQNNISAPNINNSTVSNATNSTVNPTTNNTENQTANNTITTNN